MARNPAAVAAAARAAELALSDAAAPTPLAGRGAASAADVAQDGTDLSNQTGPHSGGEEHVAPPEARLRLH